MVYREIGKASLRTFNRLPSSLNSTPVAASYNNNNNGKKNSNAIGAQIHQSQLPRQSSSIVRSTINFRRLRPQGSALQSITGRTRSDSLQRNASSHLSSSSAASSTITSYGIPPKRSHIAGPGLPEYDKVADEDRAERPDAARRRWVRSPGDAPERISFAKFLHTDLLAASTPPKIEESVRRSVDSFLSVPFAFENFVIFGIFTSVDMFLYTITFLPLRCLLPIIRIAIWICAMLLVAFWWIVCTLARHLLHLMIISSTLKSHTTVANTSTSCEWLWKWANNLWPRIHRSHIYDLLRLGLLLGAYCGLQVLNMSRIYHLIRSQDFIKLYVIMSMVEIFDRLLSSFGQDVLDSLYWTVRTNPYLLRSQPLIAFVYVWLHASLFFVNVATMNVAINSSNHALLTLLISNNFAEIKTSVFKKFDRNNLFMVASSDITERFKLCVFVSNDAF